jgi:hypothetical protein
VIDQSTAVLTPADELGVENSSARPGAAPAHSAECPDSRLAKPAQAPASAPADTTAPELEAALEDLGFLLLSGAEGERALRNILNGRDPLAPEAPVQRPRRAAGR